MESLEVIARFFASLSGAGIVSFGILYFAYFQYKHRFLKRVIPLEQEFDAASKVLQKYENPRDLFENFEEFKDEITSITAIGRVWQEYLKTLIIPRRGEGESIFFTHNPENYFEINRLGINKTISGRINSIPGTLTGLGILGTFIGLTCGIFLAQKGLTTGDTKEVTKALGDLLNGASLAFLTSIMGLSASIIYSRGKYRRLDGLETQFGNFNSKLKKLMVFKSEETLLFENLIETKNQTNSLKTFSTELATNIGKALEDQVTGNLTPLMEKLIESVENLSNKQSEVGSAAIEQASKAMNENLVSQMGSQMNQLGETFQSLFVTLEKSSQMLTEGQYKINSQSEEMAENIKQALENSAEVLKEKFQESLGDYSNQLQEATKQSIIQITNQIASINDALSSSFERAQAATEKVEKTVNLLVGFIDAQKGSNEAIYSVVGKLNETGNIIANSGKPIEAATNDLKDSIETFAPILKSIYSVSETLGQNAEKISENNQKLAEIWANYQSRFESVDDSLRGAFEEIVDGLSSYSENVQNFHKTLDDSVAQIVSQLSGAVGEFGGQIEELSEVMNRH